MDYGKNNLENTTISGASNVSVGEKSTLQKGAVVSITLLNDLLQ